MYRGLGLLKIRNCSILIIRWTEAESDVRVISLHGIFFYCFFWRIIPEAASPVISIPFLIFWVQDAICSKCGASPVAQVVKNLRAVQETQETRVWPLGWKDTLEEEMATYSSILAWIIPWAEDTVHGVVVSDTTEHMHAHDTMKC